MYFPTISGANLAGREFVLPFGLEGEFNVLLFAFEPLHQLQLETWRLPLEGLTMRYSDLRYYELPTLWDYNEQQRVMIDRGMKRAITDPAMRELVITLFVDKNQLATLLDFPNEENIFVLLVDREGEILWRTEGSISDNSIIELNSRLRELSEASDLLKF